MIPVQDIKWGCYFLYQGILHMARNFYDGGVRASHHRSDTGIFDGRSQYGYVTIPNNTLVTGFGTLERDEIVPIT